MRLLVLLGLLLVAVAVHSASTPFEEATDAIKAVCELPRDRGNGTCRLRRVYYDSSTNRCRRFRFSGAGGNANNFHSLDECKAVCRCTQQLDTGTTCSRRPRRRYYFDVLTNTCKDFRYTRCNGNANRFSRQRACQSVCATTKCYLPVDEGTCTGSTTRYYYDRQSGQCERFTYSGCGGNNNNFITKRACESQCTSKIKISPKVCTTPAPATTPASTQSPTECTLRFERGPCENRMILWYYNTRTKQCRRFVYGGCGGNTNRFATKEACDARCSTQAPEKCFQPKVVGTPGCNTIAQTRYYYDAASKQCLSFQYTGCGGNLNNFRFKYVCDMTCQVTASPDPAVTRSTTAPTLAPSTTRPAPPEPLAPSTTRPAPPEPLAPSTTRPAPPEPPTECSLDRERGPCEAVTLQWYYVSRTKQCRRFVYGGCRGNANRFATQEACETRCKIQEPPPEKCFQPKMLGAPGCSFNQTRYYYDAASKQCFSFQYTGCGGNQNRFGYKSVCDRVCTVPDSPPRAITASPGLTIPRNPNAPAACYLAMDDGPCRSPIYRYFWNPEFNKCIPFRYGGCGGNDNNFLSEEACEGMCSVAAQ